MPDAGAGSASSTTTEHLWEHAGRPVAELVLLVGEAAVNPVVSAPEVDV